MTQEDLATALDVSQSAVSAWERDLWPPAKAKRGPLCHILGISKEELKEAIDRTEYPQPDLVLFAETGSGKTATLILEVKQRLDRYRSMFDELERRFRRWTTSSRRRSSTGVLTSLVLAGECTTAMAG
jgi:transcriptional regulator with XRE-family HTH domain